MEISTIKQNSTLQAGKYKVISVLGKGGFGITYLAEQTALGRKVAIKEFFMKELCNRDELSSRVTLGTLGARDTVFRFREKFLKEARNLAKFNHPNIVRIIDVFEENDTAYYVMEYAEGGSLSEKLAQMGHMPEQEATHYIRQIALALDYVHKRRMNHLDVKPANVMLGETGNALLIDFGLSKQYDAESGNQTSTTPVGISEGYAPMEQYRQGGVSEFSPQTDVYALGATFFKLLTGITPPSASDVMEDGVPVDQLRAVGASERAISTICKAMAFKKRDRTATVAEFLANLEKDPAPAAPAPVPAPKPVSRLADNEETRVIGVERAMPERAVPEPTLGTYPQYRPEEPTKDDEIMGVSRQTFFTIMGIAALVLVFVGIFLLRDKDDLPEQAYVASADSTSVFEDSTAYDTPMYAANEALPAEAPAEEEAVPQSAEESYDDPEPAYEEHHSSRSYDNGDYAWLSQRRVTYDDIAGLSSEQIGYLRNAIYAMHGRKFVKAKYRNFFNQFSWYTPIYDEVQLSSLEQQNVAFLKRYE